MAYGRWCTAAGGAVRLGDSSSSSSEEESADEELDSLLDSDEVDADEDAEEEDDAEDDAAVAGAESTSIGSMGRKLTMAISSLTFVDVGRAQALTRGYWKLPRCDFFLLSLFGIVLFAGGIARVAA